MERQAAVKATGWWWSRSTKTTANQPKRCEPLAIADVYDYNIRRDVRSLRCNMPNDRKSAKLSDKRPWSLTTHIHFLWFVNINASSGAVTTPWSQFWIENTQFWWVDAQKAFALPVSTHPYVRMSIGNKKKRIYSSKTNITIPVKPKRMHNRPSKQ